MAAIQAPFTSGLPSITLPLNGLFQSNIDTYSAFENPLALGEQRFPLQESNPLLQMIQKNGQLIENPFTADHMSAQLPWEQNQSDSNITESANSRSQGSDGSKSWLEEWLKNAETGRESETETVGRESPEGDEETEQSEMERESEEAYMKELEALQEHYEEWADNAEEEREELYGYFELYTILLLPYLLYNKHFANYFAAVELLRLVLDKLGFSAEYRMLALIFIQCFDMVALGRGRFLLVEDYQVIWYMDIYNYLLTQLGAPNAIRVGTQIIMPQDEAPEYIDK